MPRYLIDIRLMGSVKLQIRTLSNALEDKFGLKNRLVIPHITLAGPFSTDDEARLKEDFGRVCSEQKIVPKYDIGGYGFFDNTRVVFVTVEPDEELRQFRYRLARTILPYCTLRAGDTVHRPRHHLGEPRIGLDAKHRCVAIHARLAIAAFSASAIRSISDRPRCGPTGNAIEQSLICVATG